MSVGPGSPDGPLVTVTDPAGLQAVGAVHVRVPLRRPFATASGTWTHHDAWLLRVGTPGGRRGTGEATVGPGASDAGLARLAALVRGAVDRPIDPPPLDADPAGLALRAALEAATLDLGALPGRSAWPEGLTPPSAVRRLSVPVNAVIATGSLADAPAAARAAAAAGFTTLKLKAGAEPSTVALLEWLAAVREAVGPGVTLRLDVNGAWSVEVARARLAALEGTGIEYVEQPIAPGPVEELARLRAGSPVAVAADESVASAAAADALLRARAADVLVIKPSRVGGPATALSIARAAADAGVAAVISTLLETGVGLAAALWVAAAVPPGAVRAHGLATGDLLQEDLLAEPLEIVAGRMRLPVGPGLGIRLDDGAVCRWADQVVGEWP